MGRLIFGAASFMAVILLAIVTAFFSLEFPGPLPGDLKIDKWSTLEAMATEQASARRRVLWAETAYGALPSDQALYFVRRIADNGRDLEGGCRYRITGTVPKAAWWSLTVYDAGLGTIKSDGPATINPDNIQSDADGNYTAYISAVPEPGNWLSDRTGSAVVIVYRIYKPAAALVHDLKSATLPSIAQSGGCA